jgi:hypothetical protein
MGARAAQTQHFSNGWWNAGEKFFNGDSALRRVGAIPNRTFRGGRRLIISPGQLGPVVEEIEVSVSQRWSKAQLVWVNRIPLVF